VSHIRSAEVRGGSQIQKSDTEIRRSQKSEEARSEAFMLCSVVAVTFRVSSLFAITKCYSYSKIESVIVYCSSAWWTSNKSTHRAKPVPKVTKTRDVINKSVLFCEQWHYNSYDYKNCRNFRWIISNHYASVLTKRSAFFVRRQCFIFTYVAEEDTNVSQLEERGEVNKSNNMKETEIAVSIIGTPCAVRWIQYKATCPISLCPYQ
jgi:hypothetical protein